MATIIYAVIHCLEAAREILKARGWCRDKYEADAENRLPAEREGAVCLVGACNRSPFDRATINEAVAALEMEAGAPILPWNDSRGRTEAQVMDLLDRTISRTKVRAAHLTSVAA